MARSEESSKKDASLLANCKGTKENPIPVDQVDAKKNGWGKRHEIHLLKKKHLKNCNI